MVGTFCGVTKGGKSCADESPGGISTVLAACTLDDTSFVGMPVLPVMRPEADLSAFRMATV